ncbi:MAG: hypothetical protein IIC60_06565 [Proteobacteria bacterium]|nr:hypothetical protein [Pseudomonadota bacterium]
MVDNIVDFESKKQSHLTKRKEAKVDALRRAFRLARGEADPDTPLSGRRQRPKFKKK